ncbi:aminotransferase class IV [Rosettibacter firmus]|uniref:aminotransferase class IV n=1 Tax=Rosettibacter firmus TaxID=3111522 RepID=UPI00336C02D0
MCRLIETIKIFDKKLFNIEYHNRRMNNSRKILFGCDDEINLLDKIIIPSYLSNELYKCRVIYSKEIESIEFIPYKKKEIYKVKVVENNDIEYEHKYEDRTALTKMLIDSNADEIIIIKNRLITDGSFSNIVLSDGNSYLTPATPLLKGTKRAKLLDEGIIKEDELKEKDLKKFKYIFFINAMLDLEDNNKILLDKII